MFSVTLAFMMVNYGTWKIKIHILYVVNTVGRVTVTNMATVGNSEVIHEKTN